MACLDCDIDIASCGPFANRGDVVRELEAICNVVNGSECTVVANIDENTNYCDNTIVNTAWPGGVPDIDCCPYLTVYAADGSCMWTRVNGYVTCWIRICSQQNDCFAVVPDGTDPSDFYDIGFPEGCNPECGVLIVTNATSSAQWIVRACSTDWQLITNFDCIAETNNTLPVTNYCNTLFTNPQRLYCSSLSVIVTNLGVAEDYCIFHNDGSDCTNAGNWVCSSSIVDCSAVEACPGIFTSCSDVTPCLTIADCSDVQSCLSIVDCDDVRSCIVSSGCAVWGDNTAAPFSQVYVADTVVLANLGITAGSYGSGCATVNHATGEVVFSTAGLYCVSGSLQGRMQAASCADFTDTRIDFFFNAPAAYSYQTALYDNDIGSDVNSILSISACFYVSVPATSVIFRLAGAGPGGTTCAIEAAIQFWSVVRVA